MNRRGPLALFVVLWLFSGSVGAQPAADEQAVAESLFQHARALMAAGELEEACPKFEESLRMDPKLGTLLNLAVCHEKQGKLASAWAEFMQAAAQSRLLHQPEREAFASKRVEALSARLPQLRIRWTEPAPGQQVTIDGVSLGAGAIGTPFPVDPGEHSIEVTAPDRQGWHSTVTAPETASEVCIQVPALLPEEPAPAPSPSQSAVQTAGSLPVAGPARRAAPRRRPGVHAAQDAPSSSTLRTALTWSLAGASLLGIGIGSYAGMRAIALKMQAERQCDDTGCSQDGMNDFDSMERIAAVSTVAFGVALACGGASLVLVLTQKDSKRGPASPETAYAGVRGAW